MLPSILLLVVGLVLLVWSADRFIEGSIEVARSLGMSPLLIGMIIVGFGTSVPELLVSAIAAFGDNPSLALGNAYGSNIANIALILGLTAVIRPISVQSRILKRELPIVTIISIAAFFQLRDQYLSTFDALCMLVAFGCFVPWSIRQGMRSPADTFGVEVEQTMQTPENQIGRSIIRLVTGLIILLFSSRMLVQGAVAIAQALGVSDLTIGLTIVAIGTSLPELASSIAAARKGAHDMALGNIIGSNIFNGLAVVGLSGIISPFQVPPGVVSRDIPVMISATMALFVFGADFGRPGRINRIEGALLLLFYAGYLFWLLS